MQSLECDVMESAKRLWPPDIVFERNNRIIQLQTVWARYAAGSNVLQCPATIG